MSLQDAYTIDASYAESRLRMQNALCDLNPEPRIVNFELAKFKRGHFLFYPSGRMTLNV